VIVEEYRASKPDAGGGGRKGERTMRSRGRRRQAEHNEEEKEDIYFSSSSAGSVSVLGYRKISDLEHRARVGWGFQESP
jgi:hypothetical protein